MEDKQTLTEEQRLVVRKKRESIDTFLEKFKESRTLKANLFEGKTVFDKINYLPLGNAKSAVMNYVVSREEVFEIFELLWNSLKGDISTFQLTKYESVAMSIGNLTEYSDAFCSVFGKKGLLKLVIEDLKTNSALTERSVGLAMSIIYRCCWRVPENRAICREHIEVLQHYAQSKKPGLQANAFLALSYVVDKWHADKISLNELCVKFLLRGLETAMSAPDRRSPVYDYSVPEVLQGLYQLSINDDNKLLLVKRGWLNLLEGILKDEGSTNEEKLWVARGMWQLAFKEENKIKIRQQTSLLTALKNLRNTTKDCDVKDACSGALFVLVDVIDIPNPVKRQSPDPEVKRDERGHSTVKVADLPSDSSQRGAAEGHIMMSYQHESQDRVLQVKRFLEKAGYNVWMDMERMRGDILGGMAKAVEGASVVLVCMSLKFQESQHCRTEATYAYTLKKCIVPLKLQEKFSPGDWLGALSGMRKYYSVYSEERMEQCMPDLLTELGERGKWPSSTQEANQGINSPPAKRVKIQDNRGNKATDVDDWDAEQTVEWLTTHGVATSDGSFDKVDGARLKQIKELMDRAPDFCLRSLKEELDLSLWDVLSFVNALKTI